MNKSVIEVTPKTMFGYILFCAGLLLLIYTAIQCFFVANGSVESLIIEIEINETPLTNEQAILFGILLQIGMYALLIVIGFILMKTGLNIARAKT